MEARTVYACHRTPTVTTQNGTSISKIDPRALDRRFQIAKTIKIKLKLGATMKK